MLKQQLEQGKLAATTGTDGGVVTCIMPPATAAAAATTGAALVQQLHPINVVAQADGNTHALHLHVRDPYGNPSIGSNQTPNLDSHAVLMELFARDQDLVRQAMEDAKLKAQAAKEGYK